MLRKFGTHRTVFLIGQWAIKVPATAEWRLFLHGLLANMQERTFSSAGWPELCPVTFGMPGGWFLIMRRARSLTLERFFQLFPSEDEFNMWRDGGDYLVPVEYKPDSVGLLNGQVVAVDYGS